jgi:hypothetical protein
VKATIDSMSGRGRSYTGTSSRIEFDEAEEFDVSSLGRSSAVLKIQPTARPPTESIEQYNAD